MAATDRVEEAIRAERELRDRRAAEYDSVHGRDPYERAIQTGWVRSALALKGSETVLDAGCGTGQHMDELLAGAARVVCVDHSPKSIELARERVPTSEHKRVELHAADLRELPLADASVDAFQCIEVIQHIPTHEAHLDALTELHRVLRPGGIGVLVVYRWLGRVRRRREGHYDSGLYRYAFTVREVRRLLRDAGFERSRVGAIVVAPLMAERAGISVERQCRLDENLLARPFAHYVAAVARRPA